MNLFVFVTTVGGLTSPVKGPYTDPLYNVRKLPHSTQLNNSSDDVEDKKNHQESVEQVITAGLKTNKLHSGPQTLISKPSQKWSDKITTMPELELRKLERGDILVVDFHIVTCCAWTLLMAFMFDCRLLPEQPVSPSFCWRAGAAPVLYQQWAEGEKGDLKERITFIFWVFTAHFLSPTISLRHLFT